MSSRATRWTIATLILVICAFLAFQTLTLQVGMHRYRTGDLDSALPWLRVAMALNPFTPSVRSAVATVLVHKGRLEEAERIIRKNLKSCPGNPKSHNILGLIMERRGKPEKALEKYLAAVKLDPNLAQGFFNIGYLLIKMGRFEEAREALDQAVEIAPELSEDRQKILDMFPTPKFTPEPFTPSPTE